MDKIRNRKVQHKSRVKDKSPENSVTNNVLDLDKEKVENISNLKEKVCSNESSLQEEREQKGYEAEYFDASQNQRMIGRVNFQIDIISIGLFICGLLTRMYKLEEPRNIV